MQEEQLKKATAAASRSSATGAEPGTSPSGSADPALQAKLQQLQEMLMKEKVLATSFS